MDLRALGSTGIMVSPIGLGAVKLGRNTGLKHGAFALPTDAEAAELLRTARACGVNLIDTAPAYGTSEERLGGLLAGRRDEWVICTKAGEQFDGAQSTFDFSARAIEASVERSLRRLRTDRVDIVLLHLGDDEAATLRRAEAAGALRELRRRGLVRAVGASTKTLEGAALATELFDVVMVALSPADAACAPALAEAARLGKGILVKKALASGRIETLGGARGVDPVEAALRFVFAQPGVSSVVVGTVNPAHLRHNVECARRALGDIPR